VCWRLGALIGELESAPVVAERLRRSEERKHFHGFGRVHVLLCHEPARFVGAGRKEGEIEGGVPGGCLRESTPTRKARISAEVDAAPSRMQHEGGPACIVAV
jgi:hypothetical protein